MDMSTVGVVATFGEDDAHPDEASRAIVSAMIELNFMDRVVGLSARQAWSACGRFRLSDRR